MLHRTRQWTIVEGLDCRQIAEALPNAGLQTGFRTPGGLIWVNDSITVDPDRHQEWAIIKRRKGSFVQLESITTSRCSVDALHLLIQDADAGAYDFNYLGAVHSNQMRKTKGTD